VAKLVANGQTNSEIADSLGLKIQVVETHRAAAVKKLGVHTRAELVRLAADRHWFDD
jgi:DNA-binding CsgD family transcriptional regulator